MILRDIFTWAVREIGREAIWVFSKFGISLEDIFREGDKMVGDSEWKGVEEVVRRRKEGYPLAYLLGEVEFHGENYFLGEGVFVPRKDSEILVDFALRISSSRGQILDLGCGVGNLILSFLKHAPEWKGWGIDILSPSIFWARINASRLGLRERVDFERRDLFLFLTEARSKFHLIISNPPYIPEEEKNTLPPELFYEPEITWNGGEKGMDYYPFLLEKGKDLLFPGGCIILEIGKKKMGEELMKKMEGMGFTEIGIEKDLSRRERMVWGRK